MLGLKNKINILTNTKVTLFQHIITKDINEIAT